MKLFLKQVTTISQCHSERCSDRETDGRFCHSNTTHALRSILRGKNQQTMTVVANPINSNK